MNTTTVTDHVSAELDELRIQIVQLKDSEKRLMDAEAAFKEEAAQRRMLVQQSRDGIVILEQDGKVYEANQRFADMLGYTLEEVNQLYLWDWEKNHTHEALLKIIADVDETGDHFETRHTRKDGSAFYVEICTNGTLCSNRKLVFCVCRDITERKQYEEQLRESKEQLCTFIDNFQGIAYQVQLEEVTLFKPQLFRGAVHQITGYSSRDFSEKITWNSIVHPDDIDNLKAVRQFFTETSEVLDIEYRIIRIDGNIGWVKEAAKIVLTGGRSMIFGTIFDINHRKIAEEEKLKLEEQIRHSQKFEAIGTLTGGIAHDFNNILGIIMGYTDLAISKISPESREYEHLGLSKKACNRAKEIINQLLMFSRKAGVKKVPFDLIPIVKEALIFLRSTIPLTIKIHENIATERSCILADPTQIYQVILNLCVNASQAIGNENGMIILTVKNEYVGKENTIFSEDLPEGEYIVVSVADTGCGIQPEIIDRIFDPYFTTREKQGGSGMGLSVVLGIVKSFSGAVTVNSIPGNGAMFNVAIPVLNEKPEKPKGLEQLVSTGSESILFIDDEEDLNIIAKTYFEGQGFRVTTAVNPIDALQLFRKSPHAYDIIVTDMTMPGLSGEALFYEIRKIRQDIPVIACTGYGLHIREDQALQLGISAFITKPFTKEVLTETVRKILDRS
jgi:PAS domain S-box-containing protein